MDTDTSLILSQITVDSASSEDSDVPETTTDAVISNVFLTISSLLVNSGRVSFRGDIAPLTGLNDIGNGLSFLVKRSLQQDVSPVFAYKLSKAPLYPADRKLGYNPTEKHQIRALVTECRVLTHAPLARHPNIVSLKKAFWTPHPNDPAQITVCLALEHAQLGTLTQFQLFGSVQSVDLAIKKKLCLDIAEGLLALHKCGITHGDVKTDNVLIFAHDDTYVAKLSDFGCAMICSADILEADPPTRLEGYTPYFRAPEAGDDLPSSQIHLTDVYSFGLLVWRVLIDGNEPFSTFFDLPTESEARRSAIRQIQLLDSTLCAYVATNIDEFLEPQTLSSEDRYFLWRLFSHTLALNPQERSIAVAAHTLYNSLNVVSTPQTHYGLLSDSPELEDTTSRLAALQPIKPLPTKVELLPPSIEFLAFLEVPLQRYYYEALEDMVTQYEQSTAAGDSEENIAIAYSSLYLMVACRLSEIGCYQDSTETFRLLLKLTKLEGIVALFASSTILSIRDALDISITDEEMAKAINATATAAVMESVTACRWIQDQMPRLLDHPRYTSPRDMRLCDRHGMSKNALEVQSQEWFDNYVGKLLEIDHTSDQTYGRGNTVIHAVALFGNAQMLESLIKGKGCNVDICNEFGESPLLLASMHGRSKETLCLVEAGASISFSNGTSLPHYLAKMQPEDIDAISRALHDRGVRIQQAWCDGITFIGSHYFFLLLEGDPMLRAICLNRLDVVQAIVSLSAGSIPRKFEERKRFFSYSIEAATWFHTAEILAYLLGSLVGNDNIVDKKSIGRAWTPRAGDSLLRYTVSAEWTMNRIAVHGSRFLIAAQSTLRVLDEFGFVTPTLIHESREQSTMLCALEKGNEKMATSLLDFDVIRFTISVLDPSSKVTPLRACIKQGARSTFDRLLELGAQYEQGISYPPGSSDIASYLHICAVHQADVWFAARLIDAGLSPDVLDSYGNPPIIAALVYGSYDLARLLIRRGAGLNQVLRTGYTVAGSLMHRAIRRGFLDFLGAIEIILTLDDPGKRPNFVVKPASQTTILHMAVDVDPGPLRMSEKGDGTQSEANRFDALTALILRHFAAPDHLNARDASGITPLHLAITKTNLSAVRQLLDAGADVSIPPSEGESTLSLARSHVIVLGNTVLTPGKVTQVFQDTTKRTIAIASLIYGASSTSEQNLAYATILKVYEEIEPLIAQMRQLEHDSPSMVQLKMGVISIINYYNGMGGNTEKDRFEYQQLLNTMVQPFLNIEATMGFEHFSEPLRVEDRHRSVLLSAKTNAPWLSEISRLGIYQLQQAALFEVILKTLEDDDEAVTWKDPGIVYFKRYSKTRDPADLPEFLNGMNYPLSLKGIYERMLKLPFIITYDTRLIRSFLRYLDGGANPDRFSADDPPAMTKEEFKDFHLRVFQDRPLELAELGRSLSLDAKCSCSNHKIRKINVRTLAGLRGKHMLESMPNVSHEDPDDLSISPQDTIGSANGSKSGVVSTEQLHGAFDVRQLQESLPHAGVASPASGDEEHVEHFGFFCAGASCAKKVWSHQFIKGDRFRCLPCETASFCVDCIESHRHPRLYFHSAAIERNSQINANEYERMKAVGRFVSHTVWEDGWLDEYGQLTLDGKIVPWGSPYPTIHYGFGCDGLACAQKFVPNSFIRGDRYRCQTCPNTDFCTACEPAHDPAHPRMVIRESMMTKDQFERAYAAQRAREKGAKAEKRDELLEEMMTWMINNK